MRPFHIPLVLALSSSAFCAKDSLISRSFIEFPNALPGKILEFRKVLNANGALKLESPSSEISSAADLVRLEQEEVKAERIKFGALGGKIRKKFVSMKDNDKVRVQIFLRYPDGITYYDKTKGYSEAVLKEQSLAIASLNPVIHSRELETKYGLADAVRQGNGLLICEVPKHKLQGLMFDKDIASIVEYEDPITTQGGLPALATLSSSAYSHGTSIPSSGMGNGINAATFESGLTQSFVTCSGLSIAGWDAMNPGVNAGDSAHSLYTFRCLANVAKNANLYHRNSWTYGGLGDSTWIINNHIRTTSMSVTHSGDAQSEPDYRIMDDFAYRWPYPVFNTPTANGGFGLVSNWQCYNSISVGNVRHTDQNHWELRDTLNPTIQWAGCTQTRNPAPIYGGSSGCISGTGTFPNCDGDREMPIIITPGISPQSPAANVNDQMTDPCVESIYIGCGTSLSAPTTSGMAAVIMGKRVDLLNWPERVRAALLATANNVDRGEWSTSSDGRDGAGVIFGARAVNFAQFFVLASPGSTAQPMGLHSGSLYAADFSTGDIVYNIKVPNPQPNGRHLRVVLTWDSNPVLGSNINALSDLDLQVTRNGGGTTGSYSYNSNVEIVDIPANQLTSGSTYTASIKKFANRIPAGARTDFLYYAIAWTWIDDHAL